MVEEQDDSGSESDKGSVGAVLESADESGSDGCNFMNIKRVTDGKALPKQRRATIAELLNPAQSHPEEINVDTVPEAPKKEAVPQKKSNKSSKKTVVPKKKKSVKKKTYKKVL